ncbi:response regulator, partial [Streptococcus pneumoniae]
MHLDVVIADQDVELAELYCRFLAENGFSAKTAGDGLECLRKVRRHAPDVLILDCELPWGDAEGVLACLREYGQW